jgi:hypothetical protein
MARTAVQVQFYATAFRKDDLAAALEQIGAISLRYGAKSWIVYRSQDDLYKFILFVEFDSKAEWEAYWYGEDFQSMRAACSGWYQVPLLYAWQDVVGFGALAPAPNGVTA